MSSVVVVGILVSLASLLAVVAVLLIPAALLARFVGRVEPEAALALPVTRERRAPIAWSQAHPGA